MRNRLITTLLVLLTVILLTTACSSTASSTTAAPASTTASDGASLVQERCTVCHPLTRVESSKHTAADWKTLVDMMISRGAELTPAEETVVVNYLASKYGQ
jgi:cytochrome c-type biogenesis protein CcmH/NrfF